MGEDSTYTHKELTLKYLQQSVVDLSEGRKGATGWEDVPFELKTKSATASFKWNTDVVTHIFS